MERRRAASPVFNRQITGEGNSPGSLSPGMSPGRLRYAAGGGGISNVKKAQNVAAKRAAARLAQVMALQAGANEDDDEDEEDELPAFQFGGPRVAHNGAGPNVIGRPNRNPSPAVSISS